MRHLGVSLAKHLETLDYLLFVVDEQALQRNGIFLPLVKKALSAASSRGVQAIFVVVGAEERPPLLAKGIFVPTFYVVNGFSEKDLTLLRSYIAQDIRMGHRQA